MKAKGVILLSLLFVSCATLAPGRKIKNEIFKIIEEELPEGALIGVDVIDEGGNTIFSYNAEKYFIPASCNKLITASAALYWLGPDYRFKTYILGDSSGKIYFCASGDPALKVKDLYEIFKKLKILGFSRIDTLFLVEYAFDTLTQGSGWMWDDRPYYYQAPVSSFILEKNMIIADLVFKDSGWKLITFPETEFLRVKLIPDSKNSHLTQSTYFIGDTTIIELRGHIDKKRSYHFLRSVRNPRAFFREQVMKILDEEGIDYETVKIIDTLKIGLDTILVYESPPLHYILRDFLKYSLNIYGEAILKKLGGEFSGKRGNYRDGLRAIDSFLTVAGIKKYFKIVDGSGLSRYNLSSPRGFTRLLLFDYSCFKIMPEILTSLPIGGYDGTLRKRQKEFEGRVRAKTGTMTGVSTLSGYLRTKRGKLLIFSIMINNYKGSSRKSRQLQDRILEYLYWNM